MKSQSEEEFLESLCRRWRLKNEDGAYFVVFDQCYCPLVNEDNQGRFQDAVLLYTRQSQAEIYHWIGPAGRCGYGEDHSGRRQRVPFSYTDLACDRGRSLRCIEVVDRAVINASTVGCGFLLGNSCDMVEGG